MIGKSGNGRVMGLRLAYQCGTADAYRAHIEQTHLEAAGTQTAK
ncbi:hypothetical protein [Oceaniglobus ichthyenteri]